MGNRIGTLGDGIADMEVSLEAWDVSLLLKSQLDQRFRSATHAVHVIVFQQLLQWRVEVPTNVIQRPNGWLLESGCVEIDWNFNVPYVPWRFQLSALQAYIHHLPWVAMRQTHPKSKKRSAKMPVAFVRLWVSPPPPRSSKVSITPHLQRWEKKSPKSFSRAWIQKLRYNLSIVEITSNAEKKSPSLSHGIKKGPGCNETKMLSIATFPIMWLWLCLFFASQSVVKFLLSASWADVQCRISCKVSTPAKHHWFSFPVTSEVLVGSYNQKQDSLLITFLWQKILMSNLHFWLLLDMYVKYGGYTITPFCCVSFCF